MAKSKKNLLENLSLAGLSHLRKTPTVKSTTRSVGKRAALTAPQKPDLGDLKTLIGNWEGPGFNIVELPNMNQAKPGPPPPDAFKVILNSTHETFQFSDIGGGIVNRGNAQADIDFLGLHYLQAVNDINLPAKQQGIHLETGLFLNLPGGTDPKVKPTIARLGSIPHGDSILAQGRSFTIKGGPKFTLADPTPFVLKKGKRVNDNSVDYVGMLNKAWDNDPALQKTIPRAAVMNPNILLKNAIKGQKILKTVVILLDANPVDGVSNIPPGKVGGITNIPFVEVNANATTLSAIFWIETVQNADGSTFLQLQYTQTVILDFPVFDGSPSKKVVPVKWPHISVATLRISG